MKEIQAVLLACHHARYLLLNNKCVLVTDCMRKIAMMLSGRISSNAKIELMMARLSAYNINYLVHISGVQSRCDILTREGKNSVKVPKYVETKALKDLQKGDISSPLQGGQVYTFKEIERAVLKDPCSVLPSLQPLVENGEDPHAGAKGHIDWPTDPIEDRQMKSFVSALGEESIKLIPALQGHDNCKELILPGDDNEWNPAPGCSRHLVRGTGDLRLSTSAVAGVYNPMSTITMEHLVAEQAKDENISRIISLLQSNPKPNKSIRCYHIKHGIILIKRENDGRERIVINTKTTARIAATLHSLTHSSGRKTAKLISKYFAGKSIRETCIKIASGCHFCALRLRHSSYDMCSGHLARPSAVWSRIFADHINFANPLYSQGSKYKGMLVMIDQFSSFTICKLVKGFGSAEVIKELDALKGFALLFDTEIVCDNGSAFISKEMAAYCKINKN
jgi:hypothetical protein